MRALLDLPLWGPRACDRKTSAGSGPRAGQHGARTGRYMLGERRQTTTSVGKKLVFLRAGERQDGRGLVHPSRRRASGAKGLSRPATRRCSIAGAHENTLADGAIFRPETRQITVGRVVYIVLNMRKAGRSRTKALWRTRALVSRSDNRKHPSQIFFTQLWAACYQASWARRRNAIFQRGCHGKTWTMAERARQRQKRWALAEGGVRAHPIPLKLGLPISSNRGQGSSDSPVACRRCGKQVASTSSSNAQGSFAVPTTGDLSRGDFRHVVLPAKRLDLLLQ